MCFDQMGMFKTQEFTMSSLSFSLAFCGNSKVPSHGGIMIEALQALQPWPRSF